MNKHTEISAQVITASVDKQTIDTVFATNDIETPAQPMQGNAATIIHNARKADHHFMAGANRAQKRAQWRHYKRHTTVRDVRGEIEHRAAKEAAKATNGMPKVGT